MAAFLLALGAGAVFALGTVLQQREEMTESEAEAESATILLRLARHPVWLAGQGLKSARWLRDGPMTPDGRGIEALRI